MIDFKRDCNPLEDRKNLSYENAVIASASRSVSPNLRIIVPVTAVTSGRINLELSSFLACFIAETSESNFTLSKAEKIKLVL
jgi:hypothetical protein